MSLLELEGITKRIREGQREKTLLHEVSLSIRSGELVLLWGERRSGKTSLLRIAAGLERPDAGTVRFDGSEQTDRHSSLGEGIGYVRKSLRPEEEQGVLEEVAAPLLACGMHGPEASERARVALARVSAESCAGVRVDELGAGERIRVALARTLALSPKLLIVDEPTAAVELAERDSVLALLRRLSADGVAVFAATAEPAELAGAHRALTLSDGRLRGRATSELASVHELHRRATG